MKALRIPAIIVLCLLGAIMLFAAICCVAMGPRYIARYVFWNTSDINDYKRFPSHEVKNAPPVFQFNQDPQEDVVRAALADVEYISGGETRKVGDLDKLLESTNTTAFIVIKDDAILYERYFNGYVRDSINTSFSMAKSFTSALIGIAIDEGYIDSVDAPVVTYIQELRGKGFDSLTIRHLLMMSSGFNYSETSLPGDIDFPWGDDVATYYSLDLRKTALGVKVSEPPGKHFRYNNYHPLLLGMILERTTGRSVAEYLEEKIWKPLGMEFPASWSIDSEESGFEKMESGINARAIDFAKFGRLFLNNGDWNGTRIISERWVAESTTRDYDVPTDYYRLPGWWVSSFESGLGYYKYMWWAYTRGENDYDFYAAGHLGQYVYVSPRRNLIIVRHGMNEGAVNSWPELLYKAAEKL